MTMLISLSNLNRFSKVFHSLFSGKLAVKPLLKIPPHLAYVATLRHERLVAEKKRFIIIFGRLLFPIAATFPGIADKRGAACRPAW